LFEGHLSGYRFAEGEGSAQVGVQHSIPIVGLHLEKEFVPNNPGIVDQNIDSAPFCHYGFHNPFGGCGVANVSLVGFGYSALLGQFMLQELGGLNITPIHKGYLSSFAGQCGNNRSSNAAASASYEGYLILELSHDDYSQAYEFVGVRADTDAGFEHHNWPVNASQRFCQ
jgi:hypothetical protein